MTVNAPPPGPPAWVRVDNNIPGPHARVCTDLLIDPMNPNRVYATFGGFAANNVWRTTDGGANWVQITGGGGGQLPAIPVFSIELHRQAPGWLYAGTDLGVFISTDDGATWAVPTDGPANVPVYDLLWKGNRTLISVTHGRGMYQADAGPPPVPPGRSARASVSTAGVQAGSDCDNPSISTDGRFVAFHSSASNLVPGDGNGATDVFVHDRQARDVLLASTSSTGVLGNNSSSGASMSGDGRYVAFESGATNLVPNGRPGGDDVYVRDLLTAQTYRESVSSGQQLGDANSYRAAISADGRWVAFESVATNLVPGDGNGRADVFLRDRLSQTTVRVSLSNSGLEGMGASGLPAISADGRFVSFASDAPNLVEGDTNGVQDVFVRDVVAGNTFRVSVSSQGQEGNDRSGFSSVSADGRYVAFDSIATNLVPGDTNLWEDVFVHDRVTGETRRISFSVVEAQGDGPSTRPSISDDGQVVAFYTTASNLAPRDTNGRPDVLVADCVTGRITIASVSATGVQGNNESGTFGLDLSGNGRSAAFSSAASNLVPGDTNGFRDVIVHDRFPAVAARGVARIGATLTLDLDAPDEPNQFYVMAASLSSAPGIPLDTRTFPLTAGPFLIASLTMPAVFQGFTGNLDGAGHVEARIVIPAERSLGGTTIFVAAMTLRAGAPSGVWGISTPLAIRIFGP
jgi:Tol biopolymer transport system component